MATETLTVLALDKRGTAHDGEGTATVPTLEDAMVLPLVLLAFLPQTRQDCGFLGASDAPAAAANDNRTPAGTLRDGVLTLHLVAQRVRWYPDGAEGCGVPLYGFAEEGKTPQIPGPLLRVPVGTEVRITVRNALPVPVAFRGLQEGRRTPDDTIRSVVVGPDSTQTVTFRAGKIGTFFYWGAPPTNTALTPAAQIFGQLVGGYVVDPADGASPDRILIMTRWRGNPDSLGVLLRSQNYELTAFNGLSWPQTERFTFTVGDTVRWRVIAANNDGHVMHLHGFYYQVESKGGRFIDSIYAPADRRMVVTEPMGPGQTMTLRWIPERAGNWIFHCHLMKHMSAAQRLDRMPRPGVARVEAAGTSHATHEMAGLVLGITVRPRPGDVPRAATARRTLHLFADQKDSIFGDQPGYGFVLQEGARVPAPDSIRLPGSTLVLTRGEPVQIVVHNRLRNTLSVHWHGIELESYSDGVAGWSGVANRLAPPIAPGDSFVARMTPPRAGTFIYHVHNEAGEELAAGLYGALLVVEPGARLDPALDQVFVVAGAGPGSPSRPAFVNGTLLPPERELIAGRPARIRIVSISANTFVMARWLEDSVVQEWRTIAVDGADVPGGEARPVRGVPFGPGMTRDFEIVPQAGRSYTLSVDALGPGGVFLNQPVLVRFHVRQP